MYTDEEEVPLSQVRNSIKEREQATEVSSHDLKKTMKDELFRFMAEVLLCFTNKITIGMVSSYHRMVK